jgi:hypothetical protein
MGNLGIFFGRKAFVLFSKLYFCKGGSILFFFLAVAPIGLLNFTV